MKGFIEGAKGWLYGMTLKTDSRETIWVPSSVCQSVWWEKESLPKQVGGNIKKEQESDSSYEFWWEPRVEGETKIEENIVLEMQ